MAVEHEPKPKHLIVGDQTKGVEPGAVIVGGDPSVRKITIKEVQENGELVVEIHNLIEDSKSIAPMVLDTPVIIREGI
jgi:hypothetical protein